MMVSEGEMYAFWFWGWVCLVMRYAGMKLVKSIDRLIDLYKMGIWVWFLSGCLSLPLSPSLYGVSFFLFECFFFFVLLRP